MTEAGNDLLQKALDLPDSDRALLAQKICESLNHGPFSSADIRNDWDMEIEKRLKAADAGEISVSRENAWSKIVGNDV